MTCRRYEIEQTETGVCTVQFLNHCNITVASHPSPLTSYTWWKHTNSAIKCPQITLRVVIWQRIHQHKLSLLFKTRATTATNTGTCCGVSNCVIVTARETSQNVARASRSTKYVCCAVLCLHQTVRNGKHRAIRYYSNISVSSSESQSHFSFTLRPISRTCPRSAPYQSVTYSHQVARYELWGVQCLGRDITVTLFSTEPHFVCPYKLHGNAKARYKAPPSM